MVMPLIRTIRSLLEGPVYPGQAGGLPRPREIIEEIMEEIIEAAPLHPSIPGDAGGV